MQITELYGIFHCYAEYKNGAFVGKEVSALTYLFSHPLNGSLEDAKEPLRILSG
jgi:hypothetical protein